MKLAVFGLGVMGQYSIKELAPKAEVVYVRDSNPQYEVGEIFPNIRNIQVAETDEAAVKDADFVLFCVPTHNVSDQMGKVLPYCKKNAIITGQTSRKTPEAQAFDEHLSRNPHCGLELVTIHTMCNPSKSNASKEILGIVKHNSTREAYERARRFYGGLSEHIEDFESVEDHDKMVANTQINTSKTFLSIASAFARVGCFPRLNETYSSSLDVMKFSLAMRIASQEPHVYRGIQFGSEYGKDLVREAVRVESELYEMVVGDRKKDYKQRVLAAKKKLFWGRSKPILDDAVLKQFGELVVDDPNSHFSIVQWAVDSAESGRDIFGELKATTPMYTALLCLTDRLFNTDELERSIEAPFNDSRLRSDDLAFHDEIHGWSDALLFDNMSAYDARHQQMRSKVDEKLLQEQTEKSKEIIKVCRESLAKSDSL